MATASRSTARAARPAAGRPEAAAAPAGAALGLPGGQLPAWLDAAFAQAQGLGEPPALLIHGPAGVGSYELAVALAAAALCETAPGPARPAGRACGHCPGCQTLRAGTHPDLLLLLPEALQGELGWGSGEEAEAAPSAEEGGGKSSRKPSREIRVEALRRAVAFAQQTSSRGGAKVVLVHPAERMNAVAANTLLKTLEEPPPRFRFLLSSAAPQRLLPTVRSRCRSLRLGLPPAEQAQAWLEGQGQSPEAAGLLLAAAGGAPFEALARAGQGLDAALWRELPAEVRAGRSARLAELPLPLLIDALTKLCHDRMRRVLDAAPRFFPVDSLGPAGGSPQALRVLSDWARSLRREARQAEHPWHAALALEALLAEARQALADAAAAPPLNSRP